MEMDERKSIVWLAQWSWLVRKTIESSIQIFCFVHKKQLFISFFFFSTLLNSWVNVSIVLICDAIHCQHVVRFVKSFLIIPIGIKKIIRRYFLD